jgi:quercetin dioxygenase-like cupin family protein/DNA-binding XRE family transcriptional regulator
MRAEDNGAEPGAAEDSMGARIRKRRLQLDMTLRDLAQASGLTKSFVSQIERDRNSPSIATCAYRRPRRTQFYFFQAEPTASPVVRLSERRVVTFQKTGVEYEFLTPDLQRNIEMLEMRLKPGQHTGSGPLSHDGEECAVVVEGVAEIELAGTTYRLEAGDSIYIGARQPHRSYNPGKKTAVIISAITPPAF